MKCIACDELCVEGALEGRRGHWLCDRVWANIYLLKRNNMI